jgi:hypothetical protein
MVFKQGHHPPGPFFAKPQAPYKGLQGVPAGDIHSLDEEGIVERQCIDPVADAKSQADAFVFQDPEEPGLIEPFTAGIGSEGIGKAGLKRYIHFF